MDEQRMIDDGALGALAHDLLRAGREAAPTSEAKQRVLEAVLRTLDASHLAPPARTVAVKAATHAGTKAALWAGWAVVGVSGVLAVGATHAILSKGGLHPPAANVAPARESPPPTGGAAKPLAAREAPVSSAQPSLPSAPGATQATSPPSGVSRPTPPAPARRMKIPAAKPEPAAEPTPKSVALAVPGIVAAAPDIDTLARQAATARPATAPAATPEAPRATPTDTQLAEELRRLDAVRRAMRDGDLALALQELASYRQGFPSGYLAPEAKRLGTQILERGAASSRRTVRPLP